MKIFSIFVIFVTVTQRSETNKDTTLPLRERLALLKHQIAQDINKNGDEERRYQSDVSASLERLEYVDIENQPITPINENDERKKHGRFHLRQLKTTETQRTRPRTKKTKRKTTEAVQKEEMETDIVADDQESSSDEHIPRLLGIDGALDLKAKSLRDERLLPVDQAEQLPSNIFYRRIFYGDNLKTSSKQTVHCTDLITPILTGQKLNITNKRVLTYNDQEVMRLLQLLSEDTSDLTKEEIYSSLYQISNLQIRLFQWNIASLKLLFNVVTKEPTKRHTWKSLKSGLKRMLARWHLDFSNVTNLLLQARIFRPPCIASNSAGSTKSSKTFRYTKKIKPKCEETENGGSCESG